MSIPRGGEDPNTPWALYVRDEEERIAAERARQEAEDDEILP